MARLDIAKAKQAGFSDAQIQQFAQQKGLTLYNSSQSAPTAPQSQDQGFKFSSLLPTAGGVIGGIGGSFLDPVLGPLGTVGGGAAGSALGETLRQKIEGENTDVGKIAGEGGSGLVGGITGLGLGKILGPLLGKLGAGAAKAGEGFVASQYNVPRSAARALNMSGTIEKLAKYGITNIDDIAPAAERVTGSNGILTQITREAVANAKPVDTKGFMQIGRDLLAGEPSITPAAENKVSQYLLKTIQKLHGGPEGSIKPAADPSEVFGVIQDLEKKASEINKLPIFQRTPEQISIKKVYQNMAEELRMRLFEQSGADKVVADHLAGNPHYQEILAAIHPELAKDFANARTVGDIRRIAEPFVKGSQLASETEAGSQIGFNNVGGATKGVGKLIQNPLNLLAVPLGSNTVNGGVGGALMKAGQASIPQGVSTTATQVAGQGLSHLPQLGSDTSSDQPVEGQLLPDQPDSGLGPNPANQSDMARNLFFALMLKHPDKAAQIKSMYDFGFPQGSQKLTAQQQMNRTSAVSGLKALNTIDTQIKKDPNILLKAAIPGSPGARIFETARKEAADVLTRLRTGAALNESEVKFYQSQLPQVFDSPSTIQYKLNLFKQLYQSVASQTSGAPDTIPAPSSFPLGN